MFINNLDPVAIEIFTFELRWYSLAYIFGVILGWVYIKKIVKDPEVEKNFNDLISGIILGIIIGGRIGYVLFYNPIYYLNNPFQIFMIWQGGMSFHGGLVGVVISTILFGKKRKIDHYKFLDLISLAAPIGIFFGRIANYINSELYGRVSEVIWAVKFVKIDNLNRHPSQIYEALLEGVVLFLIMNLILKKHYLIKQGLLSSYFLILYSIFRFFCEFFRQPDMHLGFILGIFTLGQMISFIFFLIGLILLYEKKKPTFR
jgi:phosphatidylglycerol:prolipoprotein diacylglycerol transferase